jgi:hypothetical protein
MLTTKLERGDCDLSLTVDFQIVFPQSLNYKLAVSHLLFFLPQSDDSVTFNNRLSRNIRTMAETSNW